MGTNVGRTRTLLPVVLLLAGCVDSSAETSERTTAATPGAVGLPLAGDTATYAGSEGTHVEVRIVGLAPLKLPDGSAMNALRLDYRQVRDDGMLSGFSEFLDAHGRRVLAATPCPAFEAYLKAAAPCQGHDRVTADWAEAGLLGGLGAAPWWGQAPAAQQLEIPVFGNSFQVSYVPKPAAVQRECVPLERAGDWPYALGGQYFAPFPDPPMSLMLCRDEPFPESVSFAEGPTLSRVSFTRGTGNPLLADLAPTFPWGAEASTSAHVGSPYEGPAASFDPSGFPGEEAIARARQEAANHSGSTHGTLRLRLTKVLSYTGAKLDAVTNTPLAGDALRHVDLEAPDGWVFSVDLRKGCALTGCQVLAQNPIEKQAPPSLSAPRSLPLRNLMSTANASLPAPVEYVFVGSIQSDVQRPDIPYGDHYVATFLAPGPNGGVPYSVTVLADNSLLLRFSLPSAIAERLIGYGADELRT